MIRAPLQGQPPARKIIETGGPTILPIGAVPDLQFLKRSGASVIGAAAGGGGDFDILATANGGVTILGNSVGPANAISFTLPGGTLGVAGLLVIAFEYFMTQTSGGNLTLNRRLKVGGVEAADVTFADSIASTVQKRYWCVFEIRPNGAQNLNDCFTLDQATQVGRNTTAVGSGLDLDTNFDLSLDKTIEVSFDWFPSAPGVTPSVKTLGPVQAWVQKAA